jgi:hypothetical protein
MIVSAPWFETREKKRAPHHEGVLAATGFNWLGIECWIASSEVLLAMTNSQVSLPLNVIASAAKQSRRQRKRTGLLSLRCSSFGGTQLADAVAARAMMNADAGSHSG